MNASETFTTLRAMGIPKPAALRAMLKSQDTGNAETLRAATAHIILWPDQVASGYDTAQWQIRTERI